ncbi:MAG: phosphotransferase family protein [bacterium]|nr:phosphotransferase family protein [bacterium]
MLDIAGDARLFKELESWLRRTLAIDVDNVSFSRASNGFSAETLFASARQRDGTVREIVLRLEQPGGEIFLDTDIADQARTLQALAHHAIAVPPLLALEVDRAVIGRRFLAMERVVGRSFPQSPNYYANGWIKELDAAGRAVVWDNALSVLGRINRLTPSDGFAFIDRPLYGAAGIDQYLGWLRAWRMQAVGLRAHRVIDVALDWLDANRPTGLPVNFIWGDSNPCNILFADDLTVAAALDFEAAALGPAEVDLGWWFFLDNVRKKDRARLSGVPDRAGCIAIYEQALSRPAKAVDYFEILGGVRMSLVIARTTQRLIDSGLLPSTCKAADENPMAAALAGLIDIAPAPVGEDFLAFVRAVTGR